MKLPPSSTAQSRVASIAMHHEEVRQQAPIMAKSLIAPYSEKTLTVFSRSFSGCREELSPQHTCKGHCGGIIRHKSVDQWHEKLARRFGVREPRGPVWITEIQATMEISPKQCHLVPFECGDGVLEGIELMITNKSDRVRFFWDGHHPVLQLKDGDLVYRYGFYQESIEMEELAVIAARLSRDLYPDQQEIKSVIMPISSINEMLPLSENARTGYTLECSHAQFDIMVPSTLAQCRPSNKEDPSVFHAAGYRIVQVVLQGHCDTDDHSYISASRLGKDAFRHKRSTGGLRRNNGQNKTKTWDKAEQGKALVRV